MIEEPRKSADILDLDRKRKARGLPEIVFRSDLLDFSKKITTKIDALRGIPPSDPAMPQPLRKLFEKAEWAQADAKQVATMQPEHVRDELLELKARETNFPRRAESSLRAYLLAKAYLKDSENMNWRGNPLQLLEET